MLLAASAALFVLFSPPRAPWCPDSLPTPPAFSAGMRAEVDPRTGRLRERPARRAAADVASPSPVFSKSGEDLVETRLPSGAVMVDLEGRFRSAAIATVDADGTLHIRCASGAKDSDHAH